MHLREFLHVFLYTRMYKKDEFIRKRCFLSFFYYRIISTTLNALFQLKKSRFGSFILFTGRKYVPRGKTGDDCTFFYATLYC